MPPVINNRNRTVRIDNTQIVENALSKSYLTADKAAASGTLTLANVEKFAVGKYVWINPFSETAEIIAVHASSAPSQPTVTLASSTVFAHYTGEPIYYVEFNQVEVSQAATVTGSKTVLATVALAQGERETIYLDTTISTGFYFARFKDSIAGTFSSYSDASTYGGFTASTVGYIIDRSLRDLGLGLSDIVSTKDCLEWINDCLRLVQGKLKRWPEHYAYNSILGQIQRGDNTTTMPTDAYDTETNRSIIALRIGDGKKLQYLSPSDFDNEVGEALTTTVRSQATSGATSLTLSNSYDFADSGTVNVWVSGTKYSITYTGVTRDTATGATGALTGVPASGTGSITVTIAAGTDVWQNATEGAPIWFTVRNGVIEHWPLADSSHDNTNLFADYAKVATVVDSESDVIDFQRFDMAQQYLTWRMKMKARNNGTLDLNDGYYSQFKERMNDAIRTLPQNNTFRITPSVNRIGNTRNLPLKADPQNLAIGDQ